MNVFASLDQLEFEHGWERDYLQTKRLENQSNPQPLCPYSLKTLGLGILWEFW